MTLSTIPSTFAIVYIYLLASFSQECHSFQKKSVCISPDDRPLPVICAATTNLNQICEDASDYSNTLITVLEGSHTLNVTCEFKHVANLTIRGINRPTISCSPSSNETGLRFLNVSHLEISDINFSSCGCASDIDVVSNLYGLPNEILSALLFMNGSNLTLTNITVVNSVSAGIYIYNVVDYVTMDSCKVINASSNNRRTMSGTVIAYDNRVPLNTSFYIMGCGFIDSGYNVSNYCNTLNYSCGLALYHGNPNLTVYISDTVLSNNEGCNGGNMALLLYDLRLDYKTPMISIINTSFTDGYSLIGGGIYLSFQNSFRNQTFPNDDITKAVSIVKSTFSNNFATYSGGAVHLQWKQTSALSRIVDMHIGDSTFENNSISKIGTGGLALDYKIYADDDGGGTAHKIAKFRVNLNISKCSFHNHYTEDQQLVSESSVILAQSAPYLGIHDTNITSNNCTAILAIGTTLVFYGSSRISNNNAFMGAGLRLCSGSLMYLTPHMELVITNNSVQQTGGGILVNTNCLVTRPICFYQYREHSSLDTINVTISKNYSPFGENNIFGGSIDYCYLSNVPNRNKEEFRNWLNVPNNTVDNPSSISSSPQHVCFYDLNDTDYVCEKFRDKTIYPGQNLTFFVRVVGQMNGAVSGTVRASVERASISESERVQTVGISGGNITYTVYPSHSRPDDEICLKFIAHVDSDTSTNENIRHFDPAMVT